MRDTAVNIKESVHPEGQAKRSKKMPDYTQIPQVSLAATAEIFEEGEPVYGRDNWKTGGEEYRRDASNHAMDHLLKYFDVTYNKGSDGHEDRRKLVAKVAWWAMTELWHLAQETETYDWLPLMHNIDVPLDIDCSSDEGKKGIIGRRVIHKVCPGSLSLAKGTIKSYDKQSYYIQFDNDSFILDMPKDVIEFID